MISATTNPVDTLPAMSVHSPFAYLILNWEKDEEYRSRATQHRGWLLIQASTSTDSDDLIPELDLPRPTIEAMRGKICGACFVEGCYFREDYDCYAYRLSQPILFPQRDWMPIKGRQIPLWRASTPQEKAMFQKSWDLISRYDFGTESFR